MKGSTVLSESVLTISSIIISFILIILVVRVVLNQQSSMTYENLFKSIARDIASIIDREASLSSDTQIEYEIPKGVKIDVQIQHKTVFINYEDKSVKKSFSGLTKTGPYYFYEPKILCFIKRSYENDIWIFDVPCDKARIPEVTTTTTTTTTVPTTTTTVLWKDRKIPPIIYIRDDWENTDWWTLHPEYGPTGSWWEQWEVLSNYGTYIISDKIIPFIKTARAMTVTMPDGSVVPKPVGVGVWFKRKPRGGLDNFVKTLAEQIEKDEYDNAKFFAIAGCYPESPYGEFSTVCTSEAKIYMDVFGEYFKKVPFIVQAAPPNAGELAKYAMTIESGLAGVKANALHVEEITEYYYVIEDSNEDGIFDEDEKNNAELVGGMLGFSKLYHEYIPVGLEHKAGFGMEQTYDVYLKGLSNHPDFFSFGEDQVKKALDFGEMYGFPLLDFTRYHLGVTSSDTPDVWIVLRDSHRKKLHNCFTLRNEPGSPWAGSRRMQCEGPQPGDYEFWLYRRDDFDNSDTKVLKSVLVQPDNHPEILELPSPAKSHYYSQRAIRRTDQSNGGYYMYFDVEDRIYFVNQIPKSEGGQYSYQIQISFVNQGTDTLSLEYKNYQGELVTKTIIKGPELGEVDQWLDYTFELDDIYFGNGFDDKADFRINSNNDGNDEYIHRIIVTPVVSE